MIFVKFNILWAWNVCGGACILEPKSIGQTTRDFCSDVRIKFLVQTALRVVAIIIDTTQVLM